MAFQNFVNVVNTSSAPAGDRYGVRHNAKIDDSSDGKLDYRPSKQDLFQLIGEVYDEHESLLAGLARDLHDAASTVRELGNRHESASGKARYHAWRWSQLLSSSSPPLWSHCGTVDGGLSMSVSSGDRLLDRLLEDEVERNISALVEDKVRAKEIRSILRNQISRLETEVLVDTTTLPIAVSATSASTLQSTTSTSETLQNIYDTVADRLTRWRMHVIAQEDDIVAEHGSERVDEVDDDDESSCFAKKAAAARSEWRSSSASDSDQDSISCIFSPAPTQVSSNTAYSSYNTASTASVTTSKNCDILTSVPDCDAGKHIDFVSGYGRKPSASSFSFNSSAAVSRQSQTSISRYFSPAKVSTTSSLKRTSSDSKEVLAPKRQKRRGTKIAGNASVRSRDVLAAAERVTRARSNVLLRNEEQSRARGEVRSTGCE